MGDAAGWVRLMDQTEPTAKSPNLAQDLSKLIELIYESAAQPEAWGDLLNRLAHTAAALHQDPVWDAEAVLRPHIAQALRLQSDIDHADQGLQLLDQTINRLPVGVAIVDADSRLHTANALFMGLLQNNPLLKLTASGLSAQVPNLLQEGLRRVQAAADAEEPLRLGPANDPLSLTLWLSRLKTPLPSQPFVLIVAASRQLRAFSQEALQQMFHLTAAEAKLVQQLLMGLSADEAAQQLGVSVNTVKTQLKQVFAKCGVKRQAELLQAIYNSPLMFSTETPAKPAGALAGVVQRHQGTGDLFPTSFITLSDGRRLAFADRGDPKGLPLLFNRGLFGSRHSASPDEDILWAKGIRLLVPDRPGCGLSDPAPGRTFLSWADDMRQLLQHLQITQCVVLGFVTGTAYALACAHRLPEQVIGGVLVSAAPPIRGWADWRWYSGELKHGLMLARYSPALVQPISNLLTKNLELRVQQYLQDYLTTQSLDDKQAFDHKDLRDNEVLALLEGAGKGRDALVEEIKLAAHPWGFDVSQIGVPLSFWHGEHDKNMQVAGTKQLANQCQKGKLTVVQGAGGYLIYHQWSELLDEALSLASPQIGSHQTI